MRFQSSFVAAVALAIVSPALALPSQWAFDAESVDLEAYSFSELPESGQIVSTPLLFDEAGEFFDGDMEIDSALFEDWKQQVVRQHNEYRARYGAPNLSWSDALYPDTARYAGQCKFQHSNGGGKYGENLAAGTGNAYGFSSGLKSWMDEASKYDYNKPGFSTATGHFTQVVWKSSKQVACAIANCRGGTIFQQPSKYIVCRYTPPGNFAGRFAENVGRPRRLQADLD
ncbi:PR-1 protein [Moniliophthora roreri MCA 2997]|uniref:Pathogenesis-related protein 1 n=2 Tax=Moniliophthora roreri TaxID=221103 RepID=A0A0W0FYY1_MONRR|nr:PR-1 protein [Moniliophthora roreri MCA 2997]QVT77443.1 pathogenesis-related protein 1 [Moniliophthora roreri]QVT77444.1 pathogenesis-related protein 1 [Moniliophthora roreri]QVT77449.1 pathogenesis-related protein 1 [Moniliophthora roreri]QVT77450.1 pathogenesis-related protein 1 [Moniliophthora roreri]